MPTSLTAKQLEEEQEILEQGQRTAHLHGLWTGAAVFLGIVVVARTSRLAFKQAGAYGVLGFVSSYTAMSHVSFLHLRDQLQFERMIASMQRSEEQKRKDIQMYKIRLEEKKRRGGKSEE